MPLQDYLKSQAARIETELDLLVPPLQSNEGQLYQAARYSLLGSGKRIRPTLTLATAEALGADPELAVQPACALELIHTYSLIHDDLPCMDDDDFRRSKPTLHKAFNEGHAVLTGDFLLTYAFEILSKAPSLSADQRLALIHTLSQRAGGQGMIGGQVLDVAAEGKRLDLAHLQQIHSKKTGALICAAIEFGGIVSDASSETMEALRRFGKDIGLTFQIVDDILDVTESQSKHGKDVASDIAKQKCTYVSVLGLESARQAANAMLHSALKALELVPGDTSQLRALAELVVQRSK